MTGKRRPRQIQKSIHGNILFCSGGPQVASSTCTHPHVLHMAAAPLIAVCGNLLNKEAHEAHFNGGSSVIEVVKFM